MWRWLTVLPCLVGALAGLEARSARGGDAVAVADVIDRHIQARLDSEGVRRVPLAEDSEFLRRVFLDLHGVVPSPERAVGFLDSTDPDKRAQLIDELLASPRFGEHLADLWQGRLLSPQLNDAKKREAFTRSLIQRFNGKNWDAIVYDLLTATGKLEENPEVIYLIEGNFPLGVTDLADLSTRYFLGLRMNCAQCHDHPFAAWKQQDYWGMAAFFAQIQTPGRPKAVYKVGLQDSPQMTLASLQDANIERLQVRPPTFLGGEELKAEASETHRAALAHWITAPENPYFARAMVNRMWDHFFGRGIVNPVDDMHEGNAPSHPELLEQLSRRFAESGFDLKFLCRAIAASRTYQATSRPGERAEAETNLFARMPIKVLSAEQLYDSLVATLGPPQKTAGVDTRLGARNEFAQSFAGDGESDATRYERGIPHMLRLMNSAQFAGNVSALISRITSGGRSPDEVLDELFLTMLSRRPTPAERQLAGNQLRATDAPQTAYRELAWALMMSSEFSLNR